MYRFLTLILITITIASCGSKDSNDKIKLSSLIQPNFTFTYDLIECELNENSSLLDLETVIHWFLCDMASSSVPSANSLFLINVCSTSRLNC